MPCQSPLCRWAQTKTVAYRESWVICWITPVLRAVCQNPVLEWRKKQIRAALLKMFSLKKPKSQNRKSTQKHGILVLLRVDLKACNWEPFVLNSPTAQHGVILYSSVYVSSIMYLSAIMYLSGQLKVTLRSRQVWTETSRTVTRIPSLNSLWFGVVSHGRLAVVGSSLLHASQNHLFIAVWPAWRRRGYSDGS